MKIKDLIPPENIISGNARLDVVACTFDYKKATEDSLLFVLPGVNFDTYTISDKYIRAKPRAIVTEKTEPFQKSKIPIIRVKSARLAYAYACYNLSGFDYSKLKLIGVTGTNGKTSTATMLKHILTENKERVGFIGTGKIEFEGSVYSKEGYSMTSPDPELLYPSLKKMYESGATAVVMEVSSHALALEKLSPLKFDLGIFTGLSHEHLDFHKTMENYLASKEMLINNAKRGILNVDDKSGRELYERYKEKCVGVGIMFDSDIRGIEPENRGFDGYSFIIKASTHMTKISLPLPGIYNVYNALLSFAAAKELGISPKGIKDALAKMHPIDGRFEIIKSNDFTVIIDYAHTPDALENLLKNINTSKNIRQNIYLVFGCGGERDKEKRPLMAGVAQKYAAKTIVTSDNPRGESAEKIIADIVSGFGGGDYGVIVDREKAIRYAIHSADKNDIVVIAGKGHERYVIDSDGYHPFDERKTINEALNEREAEGL